MRRARPVIALGLFVACASAPPSAPQRPPATAAPTCVPPVPASETLLQFPTELAASQGFWLGAPRRVVPTEDGRLVLFLRSSPGAGAAGKIALKIDARGTSWRDRAWHRAFYQHYGDLPVDGHADAIAALAKAYPEIDPSRVGIYGWSNGGYVSAMAILRRPDVFKVAVAGAPVADLRDYDAIMEAFFGPPGDRSWDEASLLTWAAKPVTPSRPARPLLLIHGTADDNVYVAHALKLAAAMGLAGRPVEFMPLLDQTHMVSAPDSAAAVSRRIAAHFRAHLYGPPCGQ